MSAVNIPEFLIVSAIIAFAIVFLIDLIGNAILFDNKLLNAVVSAVVFFLLFGGFTYFRNGEIPQPVYIGAAIMLVIGLLGNLLSFGGRLGNAFVTALLFVLIFGPLTYFMN